MRKNFALVSATMVACLVFKPALADEKPVKTAALETAKVAVQSQKAPAVTASAKVKKKIVKNKVARKRTHERLVAKISLSSQRMTILVNGKVKHSWKISSGAKGHYTPTGSYKPYLLETMHYSRKYNNAPMPHSVFFRGGFAIHATGSTWRLGTPASHGCIRLHPSNARKFFKLVQKYKKAGTRIRISGSTPAYKSRKHYARKKKARRRSNSWASAGFGGNYYTNRSSRRSAKKRTIRIRRSASNSNVSSWSF